MFIISFSHLFHLVKIYHLSFFRYLYYSKPFLAYYASFHVLTCIIHSLNEHKKLNITPLSRFSFFDDIFLSAVKQLKSLVKVFLEKMLRTKERLLGNLRPLRRSHQRYCNRTQLSISPFFPEFHLRSQHCSLETRENELRERIPVPYESLIFQVRTLAAKVIFVCCFRDPATWSTFTRTWLVSPPNIWSLTTVTVIRALKA